MGRLGEQDRLGTPVNGVSQVVFRVVRAAASISAWQLRWGVRACFQGKPPGGEQPPPVRVSAVAAAAALTTRVPATPSCPPAGSTLRAFPRLLSDFARRWTRTSSWTFVVAASERVEGKGTEPCLLLLCVSVTCFSDEGETIFP